MFRSIAKLIVAFPMVAFASQALGQPGCAPDECVRIGSFNIQLLGRGGPAGPKDTDLNWAARLISEEASFDLAVLEEIDVESHQWAALRAKLEALGYDADLASSDGGANEQYIVIIYRPDRIQRLSDSSELDIPTEFAEDGKPSCFYDNFRRPLTARFQAGEFDFRLVGVHMKSKRSAGSDPSDDECDDRLRRIQAGKIVDAILELQQETGEAEQDLLIVGDFNDDSGSPFLSPFADAGFESAITPGSLADGSGEFSYLSDSFGDDRIDHVMFRSASVPEWVAKSGMIFVPGERPEYLSNVSDHAPVWTLFSTTTDDE